ncbi:hypothetical protein PR048_010685 [Dryococelus australis]|uniref:Uncharacterized protein n=1 Tax=Dryococelus australis TaxID=614101 RepID=A0ABQ9I3E0_9NEOP|nr:hypothetical protein PR048_010685 [Dryococelus australis]
MLTVLTDCELVAHVLCISEICEELVPLKPLMFIQDNSTVGVPDLDCINEVSLSKRFQYHQHLRDDLRERFHSEYCGQILQHP